MSRFVLTSESVSEGHPDKVADLISDSALDACLSQDPTSKVAVETLVKEDLVVLAGDGVSDVLPEWDRAQKEAERHRPQHRPTEERSCCEDLKRRQLL